MEFIFKGEPKCQTCQHFSPTVSSEDLFGDGNVVLRQVMVGCEHREGCSYLVNAFADKIADFTKAGYRLDFFETTTESGERCLSVHIYNQSWDNCTGVLCPIKDQAGVISNDELCSAVDAAYEKLYKGAR